jgi:hypothetical protein
MNKGVVGGTPATARGTRAIPQDFVLGGVARNFKNSVEMRPERIGVDFGLRLNGVGLIYLSNR